MSDAVRPATPPRPWVRLLGEGALVVVTIVICVAAARLAPSDTALVVVLVVAALALLRVLPEAHSPRLRREAAPGRSGRRADVYRLSWGVTAGEEAVGAPIARRVATVVAERLELLDAAGTRAPQSGSPDQAAPHVAVLRELAAGTLASHSLTPRDLRRALTALEELDRLDRSGAPSRGHR